MDLFLTGRSTVQCVNVTIISDLTLEMNETFFVTLSLSSADTAVLLPNNVSTVTIIDTDSMLIMTAKALELTFFHYFSC